MFSFAYHTVRKNDTKRTYDTRWVDSTRATDATTAQRPPFNERSASPTVDRAFPNQHASEPAYHHYSVGNPDKGNL
jgi:hypothetical protein